MEKDNLKPFGKLVVIGGSAGSLDVLLTVLPRLEKIDTIAIVIVLHRRNSDDSVLEELLRMKSGLQIKEVEDKTLLKAGRIHIAPADYHLLFEKDLTLSLDISEKVNYSRPSIDIAFESAADAFGSDVIGVLLSGANADGTEGLLAVKNNGGLVIVQSPDTADVPYMPAFAVDRVATDHILNPVEMADFINRLS